MMRCDGVTDMMTVRVMVLMHVCVFHYSQPALIPSFGIIEMTAAAVCDGDETCYT